jgi:hypothetical protein
MTTVKFITVELPAASRKAFRLNLTPALPELIELNLWSNHDDLSRWLELHSDIVQVSDAAIVPGGVYTLIVAEFADFTLYGYLQNEIYHWSTISKRNVRGVIHTASSTYRDLIYADSTGDATADIPYKQHPNALLVGVDAKPLLDQYALLDSRFVLTHGRYITSFNLRHPLNWVNEVCQHAWYQYQVNKVYNLPITTVSDYSFPHELLESLQQLYSNPRANAIDFTNLDAPVEFVESDIIDDDTIELCLASLTDPLLTYDEDLWLHNVGQVEQLLSAIATTNP